MLTCLSSSTIVGTVSIGKFGGDSIANNCLVLGTLNVLSETDDLNCRFGLLEDVDVLSNEVCMSST